MENAIGLLCPQYVLGSVTTTSQQITIEDQYRNSFCVAVIDNSLGATAVFVTAGLTSQTAVFPSSSTVAALGSVVGAGKVQSFNINPNTKFIVAIRASGSADVYIKLGSGVYK